MRYLALIHADEQAWAALGDEERRAVYDRYRAFSEDARAAGKLVEGYELQPVATATTVRVVDGETVVTDGPFAELREQIGGYFVLDCDSIDEAVALAARIPAAEHGAVEVRPGVENGS
ncbi:MAG: YciI family protein [Pseudomonadota bacterium]